MNSEPKRCEITLPVTRIAMHRNTLVIGGPLKFTRNPMYLGLALLTASAGLFLDTWWPILLLVPALAIVQRFVIAREERYLRRRFGA